MVRAGALGDVLLLRRVVAALGRAGYGVHLLAPARSGRVLVGPGEASGLTALDGPELAAFLGGGRLPPRRARELRSDVALAVTRDEGLLERLRGVAPRVLPCDPFPDPGRHASHWFAGSLAALGVDPGIDPPALRFTAEEEDAAREAGALLPRAFLALHPGSGSVRKNWPVDRFAELIRSLTDGAEWLLVGGPADEAAVSALAGLPGAVAARHLPVRVLGALLTRAGLYVGNDSGVSHLAAASGAPTLVLFGPTDPATWSPVGPMVDTVSSPDGTMRGLALSDVQAAAERLRAEHGTTRRVDRG